MVILYLTSVLDFINLIIIDYKEVVIIVYLYYGNTVLN